MTPSETITEIQAELVRVRGEHYKLLWVAGGKSADRSALLHSLAEAASGAFVDLGKALSSALLEVPPPLRTVSVEEILADRVGKFPGQAVCLDHLEILFEPSLQINPVALLKRISRHALIVASWPGTAEAENLLFGPPDHPSHMKIAMRNLESAIQIL